MILAIEKTKALLKSALSEGQGSGFALAIFRKNAQEFSYTGYHYRSGEKVSTMDLPNAEPDPVGPQSIFDLASLTKILVTTPLLMETKRAGLLDWSDPVEKFVPELDKSGICIRHLMAHNAGFLAHEKYYERASDFESAIDLDELMGWIAASNRTNLKEAKTIYSDLGAITLGVALERIYKQPICQLFQEKIAQPLHLRRSGYRVLPHAPKAAQEFSLQAKRQDFVATANCPIHKRLLIGEVDDHNCWALGGYSAHAGLFASLEETMLLFCHAVSLAEKEKEYFFIQPDSEPPFTHGFMIYPGLRQADGPAWKNGIGHTGFVGTSAWYHPETETYVVLLGNARVYPSRDDDRFINTRLNLHAVLYQELNRA